MEYEFELALIIRKKVDQKTHPGFRWDLLQIEKVLGNDLVEILSKFLIVIASLQKRWEKDLREELKVWKDDDIPF